MNTKIPDRTFKWRGAAALALALCCLAGTVSATGIISIKFTSPKTSNQNWMFAGDYAGAPGVRTNNWNNLLATADGNASPITLAQGTVMDASGAVLPDFWVYAHPTTSAGGGGIYNRTAGGTNDGKLFADVSDTYQCNGFGNYGYVDLTNIPYANYSIYCYFRDDNGNGEANARGGFFCITNTLTGTNRFYIKNQSNDVAFTQVPVPSNSGGGYLQSPASAIATGSSTFAGSGIAGGSYVAFNNLTNSWTRVWFGGLGNGTGGQDDLGNSISDGSGAVRFKIAGFQIVQVPTGVATALYLLSSNLTLHAGNPAGTQVTVLADLDTGATGVDKTTASGISYAVVDPAVATVSGTGLITPGTNGATSLIVSYQGLSWTNPVTVIGPTSLAISVVKTNLLAGNGQGDTTVATLTANFSDATGVTVNGYSFVNFSSTGGVTVTANGTITAASAGAFSLTGTYDGLAVTTNNAGLVTPFTAPGTVAALSVDFADASAHGMTFHDLSGAPGARVGYWNDLIVPSGGNVTNNFPNPTDYHGNAFAGTLVQWIPGSPSGSALAYTQGTLTTNESVMFGALYDQGMNDGTSYNSLIVVSNVPFASYDVYVYFYNDTGNPTRPAQVTIDGVTQYRVNSAAYPTEPDNNGNGYVQAVPPGTPPTSVAQVPFGNYIKFANITDNVLNINWGAVGQDVFLDAAGVTRARIVGFQLVKSLGGLAATNVYLQAAVPAQLPGNPASFAVTVLADFNDGEMGGNITALAGVNYSSSDPDVFTVAGNVITPGQTPGVATLTITYQTNTLNVNVTNLAPAAVRVVATPGTVYLDGVIGVTTAQAGLYADFPGYPNQNISSFSGVSFVDQGSAAAAMDASGAISASAEGQANLGASYLGATWVTTNGFTVRSVADAPVLAHLYTFTNAANATVVLDTVGTANGTVYAPLGTNQAITFDGSHVLFPGDGDYTTEPYISLTPGLINAMGDVTIEMWGGQSQRNAWARFLGFGTTGKGLNPHNTGAEVSDLELLTSYAGTGDATCFTPGHGADVQATPALANGTEYHLVMVYAPNAGTAAFYINGVLAGSGTPTSAPLSTSVNDTVDWLGVSLANNDLPLAGWMNKLAIYEGAMSGDQVLANYNAGASVYLPPYTVSTVPTNMVSSVSGSMLTLAWPADHLGWKLQVQTNVLGAGLGTNWVTVPGSQSATSANIPIDPANGAVLYRLTYP